MISLDNLKTTLNAIKCLLNDYAKKKDVPTKLPNPKRLNFTGAVKKSYDGSKALTVEIPYSVQSDWNQNDSTALNYIKNRPFYTGEPVETVLVEETTVSFADAGGLYIAEFPSTFKATVGDTYTVNWDGTKYECVCSVLNSVPVLGNLSITGAVSDTGEPFIMLMSNGKGLQIRTLDTSASHTISISGFIAQNVQIPDKYISDTFRDVIIAGDPRKWSATDWTKYYDLFQGGKLLKINSHAGSEFEGYALSMLYKARVSSQISVITSTGGFFKLSLDSTTNELYWEPIFNLNMLYFRYQKTGHQEEYQRLEVSDGLKFTTKTSAEDPVQRKVVLEGDNVSAFTNDAGYLTLDTLPNPNPLTFTGAVTGSYDGSEPLNIEIPMVEDIETIRAGAAKGATALQSVPNTYRTASEQDTIDSGKVDKVTGKGLSSNDYTDAAKAKVDALAPVATSGNYNDLTNKPTIPAPVTEQTVSGWGFTKNTGTYSKPTGGIPKADLANDVQASLGKAETALQEHQSLAAYRTSADQDVIDGSKQDKLIAGDNITIAADGKTISATGGGGTVPKPLTYDYMPEGYPTKVNGIPLLKEQVVAFTLLEGIYAAAIPNPPEIVEGQTYTVNWDGAEYECVCGILDSNPVIGNLSIAGGGNDTGEPFLYMYIASESAGQFGTLDTSASHTIAIKKQGEGIIPMAYYYMPDGYPKKTMETATVMEEQEFSFEPNEGGRYKAVIPSTFEIVLGNTYIVKWDGTEYECVSFPIDQNEYAFGNIFIFGVGADSGVPFVYVPSYGGIFTLDTSPTHTISVKTTAETITPMAAEFIPQMNVSAFTNDAGYLTLATLPKYEGVVE